MKRHVMIVGCTKGAGYIATSRFAETGHVVSVIGRQVAEGIRYWQVDVVDAAAVRVILQVIAKRGPKGNAEACIAGPETCPTSYPCYSPWPVRIGRRRRRSYPVSVQ